MSQTTLTVRGYHLDGYGHVNHARYLEFLEEARWAYFEHHHLLPHLGDATQIVVTHIDIHYKRSATSGDILTIHTHIHQLELRRVVVKQTIYLKDKIACEALITLATVAQKRSIPIPDALSEKLNALITPVSITQNQ